MSQEALDPRQIKFTESMLRKGECPLCDGRGEMPSETSPTGYVDCFCKHHKVLLGILGPRMIGIAVKPGESKFHKYYGKNFFIRASTEDVNQGGLKRRVFSQVRRILRNEFHRCLQVQSEGGFLPHPEWLWVQSEEIVSVYFSGHEEERQIRKNLMYRHPWVLLELGKTSTHGNTGYAKAIPSLLRSRSDFGLSTWVVSTRDDKVLRQTYGQETLDWLVKATTEDTRWK